MINVDSIKKHILSVALQGKLTRQNPQDESAQELLIKIKREKLNLINSGEIRNKKSSSLESNDVAFDIPDNWAWCFLEDISFPIGNKNNQIQTNEIQPEGKYPVVSQGKTFIDGYTDLENKLITNTPIVLFGDHTKNVKYLDFNFVVGADGTKLIKPIIVDSKFFYYLVLFTANSLFALGYARHYSLLKKKPLPLPPLNEQKRIVERLDEIFSELDKIECQQQKMFDIQDKIENKILALAVTGKLVEQYDFEENADVLLKKIQIKKNEMISSHDIRNDKELSKIGLDEIPFDIPSSWKWCKFGDLISLTSGVDLKSNEYYPDMKRDSIPYITGASSIDDNGNLIINRFTNKKNCNSSLGDILITCKGTIGKISINNIGEIHLARQLMGIKTFIDFDYTRYFLQYIVNTLKEKANGLIPGIDRGTVRNYLIPLPPIEEQKRIVSKLEEVLPFCRILNK